MGRWRYCWRDGGKDGEIDEEMEILPRGRKERWRDGDVFGGTEGKMEGRDEGPDGEMEILLKGWRNTT